MWEIKSKSKLFITSKIRIGNFGFLAIEYLNRKECFSATKIFLKIAKKYSCNNLEILCNKYTNIYNILEKYIDVLNNQSSKYQNLNNFLLKLKDNKYKEACNYADRALKELSILNEKFDVKHNYHYSFIKNDIMHIVSSSAFRRLQFKAQVYSLLEQDYPRTRLTHSIEVSSTAEKICSLINFNDILLDHKSNDSFSYVEDCTLICRCISLLHDIGNPPFGHAGERVISKFFSNNYKNTLMKKGITEDTIYYNDLIKFDGNAQGFRIITKLQYFGEKDNLMLPAAVLSAFIKYPFDSLYLKKDKLGYFYTEAKEIENLKIVGAYKDFYRHPLSLILEVSDDISYITADIEDAIHSKYLTISSFKVLENDQNEIVSKFYSTIDRIYNDNKNKMSNLDENIVFENSMRPILADLKSDLIQDAAQTFMDNIDEIIYSGSKFNSDGTHFEISKASIKYNKLYSSLEKIMETLYKNKEIVEKEEDGATALNYLLKYFCDAVLSEETSVDLKNNLITNKTNSFYNYLLGHISKDFVYSFIKSLKFHCNNSSDKALENYLKIRLVIDYISGMTDRYVMTLYDEIKRSYPKTE